MDYQEALLYITELQKNKGSDYSLEPVRRLCELAGNPDRDLSIVHIAGTNGKGSIGSYLGNIMAMSGYTVGRYVSPTLLDYRERIQRIHPAGQETCRPHSGRVGFASYSNLPETESFACETLSCGQVVTEYITEQEVADSLTWLRSLAEQMEMQEGLVPTAFEIETVMAFLLMKQWGVDVAVIECGMGGKMDATNIITSPILCVFSRIGLDHTGLLGETLAEITGEKAGILKKGCVAVSVKQDKSVEEVLQQRCLEQEIPLFIADPQEVEQVRYHMQGTSFHYRGSVLKTGQQGSYQIENAITAMEAANSLRRLGYDRIQETAVRDALACSHHPGRFECICENPYVIVDGAHNPQAAAVLRQSLESYFPGEQFSYICGVFRDKEYTQMMDEMLPFAKRIYTIQPPGPRGLPAETLAAAVRKCSEKWIPVQACGSVAEALDLAVQEEERIVVFGSLSFLHKVYEYWNV